MRGQAIPLSLPRRFVGDFLHFAKQVPSIPVQRWMQLEPLREARAALEVRPGWTTLFTKAYGIVAAEFPELRRAYVKLPWPHLFEYVESVASIATERRYRGEAAIVIGRVKNPAQRSIAELDQAIRLAATIPIEESKDFQRALRLTRLPVFLRRPLWWLGLNIARQRANYFGTFLVSVYSGLGAESLHPLSPLTTTLNFGVIGADGSVSVRLIYDHRVLDGATVARALARLETVLREEITLELRLMASQQIRAAA